MSRRGVLAIDPASRAQQLLERFRFVECGSVAGHALGTSEIECREQRVLERSVVVDGCAPLPGRATTRPLLQIAVLFDEYLDEVHLPVVPFAVQRLLFRALAWLGRRRGYGSIFPEYGLPEPTGYARLEER